MKPHIITIGRQLGAGGRAVGRILAKELNMTYLDKEILSMAANESGYSKEIFEKKDEKKGFFTAAFKMILPYFGTGEYYSGTLSDEVLFRLQSQAISKVAHHENCIFIGRAADYVLRNHPRCLKIFLTADREERIQRIMKREETDRKTAIKHIEKGDEERAEFYNFYSPSNWGEASTYDLCINTSVLGIERTALAVKAFMEARYPEIKDLAVKAESELLAP